MLFGNHSNLKTGLFENDDPTHDNHVIFLPDFFFKHKQNSVWLMIVEFFRRTVNVKHLMHFQG